MFFFKKNNENDDDDDNHSNGCSGAGGVSFSHLKGEKFKKVKSLKG